MRAASIMRKGHGTDPEWRVLIFLLASSNFPAQKRTRKSFKIIWKEILKTTNTSVVSRKFLASIPHYE